MSTTGRTTWWPKDAAWHRRDRIVELGAEHGAAGPMVLDVLCAWAQEQREDGAVKGGFVALAREAFVSPDQARTITEHAARIGAVDDLEPSSDGRLFTCRISGWESDQTRGRAAIKKAGQRAEDAPDEPRDVSPQEGTKDGVVPREGDMSPLPDQTRPTETSSPGELARLDDARSRLRSEQVVAVFDAWTEATRRDANRTKLLPDRRRLIEKALASHGLDDCLAAVRNIGADAWAAGANERRKPFNDLKHALGNAERIERWRDATATSSTVPAGASSSVARGDALIAQALAGGTA
ncbi:MAG: hypothetical protein JWM47_4569 [Acidimicrobiales bacterium]|nr:hypothetical protein [Acidimicrobiales bacterium]